jgi:hypothetical protein
LFLSSVSPYYFIENQSTLYNKYNSLYNGNRKCLSKHSKKMAGQVRGKLKHKEEVRGIDVRA